MFLAGVALFTLASIACGSADSQAMLVGARFVQGIGGALSSSVIVAIIVTEFPRQAERTKAMSAYVFVAVGGGSIGLLAGGVLTQALSWHWIFFVNVPVGIATLIAGSVLLVDNIGLGIQKGVDIVGSVLITLSVMVGIYAIVTAAQYGWVSAHTLGFGAAAIVLGVTFLVLESRLSNPIMPLRILRLRTLTGTSVIRGVIIIGMFSTFFVGALYFEHVRGYSPFATGVAFLPQAVAMATMSLGATARLVNRFGPKPVMYPALVLTAAGLFLFASAGLHTPYFPRIFLAMLMLGVGASCSFMPLLQIGMSEIPNEDAGLGSGIVNVSQQLAGSRRPGRAEHDRRQPVQVPRRRGPRRRRRAGPRVPGGDAHRRVLRRPRVAAVPDPPTDEGVARGAAGPHRREHGDPRGLRAPGPVGRCGPVNSL